jgi:hypothetical protein
VSLSFVHVHLPSGTGTSSITWCLELPSEYIASRECRAAVTRSDERLLHAPAWRPLFERDVNEALTAFDGGDVVPLARLIADVPNCLLGWESVQRALVADVGSRSFKLLKGIAASRGRMPDPETLARHEQVSRLIDADERLQRVPGMTVFDANGRPRSVAATTDDARITEVAESRSRTGASGYVTRGGEYGRVKKAMQRVRERGVTKLVVLHVPCALHEGHSSPAPVDEPNPFWTTIGPLPPIDGIESSRIIRVAAHSVCLQLPTPDSVS